MASYSLAYNGLTIDGTGNTKITDIQGLHGLPSRVDEQPLPGIAGGNIFQILADMRVIGVDGQIFTLDANTFFSNIRTLVNTYQLDNVSRLATIQVWDGSSKSIYAKTYLTPQITHSAGKVTRESFRVELKAEFPYFQDNVAQTFTTFLAQPGGFAIPFAIPFAIGGTTANQFTINNIGDIVSAPEYYLYGPLTNPTIQNLSTGAIIRITTSIPSGSYLHIYLNQQGLFIKLNDTTDYWQYYAGQYFYIQKGLNTILFNSANNAQTGHLTTNYVNYWNGI